VKEVVRDILFTFISKFLSRLFLKERLLNSILLLHRRLAKSKDD